MSNFPPHFVKLAGFGGCVYAVLAEKFRRNIATVNAQPSDDGPDGEDIWDDKSHQGLPHECPQYRPVTAEEIDCPNIFEDVQPSTESPIHPEARVPHSVPRAPSGGSPTMAVPASVLSPRTPSRTPRRRGMPALSSPRTGPMGGDLFHPVGEAAALTPPDPWDKENTPQRGVFSAVHSPLSARHSPRSGLRPMSPLAGGPGGLPLTPDRQSPGGLGHLSGRVEPVALDFHIFEDEDSVGASHEARTSFRSPLQSPSRRDRHPRRFGAAVEPIPFDLDDADDVLKLPSGLPQFGPEPKPAFSVFEDTDDEEIKPSPMPTFGAKATPAFSIFEDTDDEVIKPSPMPIFGAKTSPAFSIFEDTGDEEITPSQSFKPKLGAKSRRPLSNLEATDDEKIKPSPSLMPTFDAKSTPAFSIFEDTGDEEITPSQSFKPRLGVISRRAFSIFGDTDDDKKAKSPFDSKSPLRSKSKKQAHALPPRPKKSKPKTPARKSICPSPESEEPQHTEKVCEILDEPARDIQTEKSDWRHFGITHRAVVDVDLKTPPRHQTLGVASEGAIAASPPWTDETPKTGKRPSRELSWDIDGQSTPHRKTPARKKRKDDGLGSPAWMKTPERLQEHETVASPSWGSDLTPETPTHRKPPMSPRLPSRGLLSPSWALTSKSPVGDRYALQPLEDVKEDFEECEHVIAKPEEYSFLEDPTERLRKYPNEESGEIFPPFEVPNRSLIHHQNFLLCYDNHTRTPLWALELVTKDNVKPMNWYPPPNEVDKRIPEEFRSDVNDYRSAINRYKEMQIVKVELHQDDVDYVCQYSNVAPQATAGRPHAIRTLWDELHDYVVHLTEKHKSVWILSGVLYSPEENYDLKMITNYEVIGDHKVSVPTHFFKVILAPNLDRTQHPGYRLECYMFKNEFTSDLDLRHYHVPRCNLESKAGFKIFDVVDDQKVSIKDTDPEFVEKRHPSCCTQD